MFRQTVPLLYELTIHSEPANAFEDKPIIIPADMLDANNDNVSREDVVYSTVQHEAGLHDEINTMQYHIRPMLPAETRSHIKRLRRKEIANKIFNTVFGGPLMEAVTRHVALLNATQNTYE